MTLTTDAVLEQLTERIADWRGNDLTVERDARVVRNIALTGLQSRNGYRYSREALSGAVPLYENKPVFLDHSQTVAKPFERSTRDLVGSIVRARFDGERIRGDVDVLDTEAGRTFLALAEADTAPVGMSHVVLARKATDRKQVESIEDVVSVDAVMYPATTRTFRESIDGTTPTPLPGSAEAIRESLSRHLPAHLTAIAADRPDELSLLALYPGRIVLESNRDRALYALDWSATDGGLKLGEQLQQVERDQLDISLWRPDSLQEERDDLLRQLAEARRELAEWEQKAANDADVARLIESSGLPDFAVTDSFRRQLQIAAGEEERRGLIQDRRELVVCAEHRSPSSRARSSSEPSVATDETIVNAIRRHRPVVNSR